MNEQSLPLANSAPIHNDERLAEIVRVRAEIAAADIQLDYIRFADITTKLQHYGYWRGVRDTWEQVLARLVLPEQDGA